MPGGSAEMRKLPSLSVSSSRLKPVFSLVAVTLAPTTAAPCGSVICPNTWVVPVCPQSCTVAVRNSTGSKHKFLPIALRFTKASSTGEGFPLPRSKSDDFELTNFICFLLGKAIARGRHWDEACIRTPPTTNVVHGSSNIRQISTASLRFLGGWCYGNQDFCGFPLRNVVTRFLSVPSPIHRKCRAPRLADQASRSGRRRRPPLKKGPALQPALKHVAGRACDDNLEDEPHRQPHVAGALEDLGQPVTAARSESFLVQLSNVIKSTHHKIPVNVGIVRNTAARARRTDYGVGGIAQNEFVVGHARTLVEQVGNVRLEGQTQVLVRLADLHLVAERHIRLEVVVASSVADNPILHVVAIGRAVVLDKVAAPLGPLAGRRSADHRQAGGDRSSL